MEGAQISAPLVWRDLEAEKILIGKVLSTKMYTRAAMETILQKAWNMQTGFDVVEISKNAFMFKFSCEEEYCRILRGRPWTINGCLLNLQERAKYKSCEEFDFSRCPVWIQMHNVPMEAMCLENAITIGGYVGEVVLAEDPCYNGRYLRSFLRVRVVLDLRKPLPYGFWMPKPIGGKTWISIRYEKLQNFCFNCGKIGHDNRICKAEKLMSVFNPSEPCYGGWLTTNVSRSWDEVMVVVRSDWIEAGYVRRKKEEANLRNKGEDRQKYEMGSNLEVEDLFSIKVNKFSTDDKGRKMDKEKEIRDPMGMGEGEDVSKGHMPNSSRQEEVKSLAGGRDNEDQVMGPRSARKAMGVERSDGQDVLLKSAANDFAHEIKNKDEEHLENSLAIIPYDGKAMNDVICGINGLGLKRIGEEDLEDRKVKRRKLNGEDASTKHAISIYAESLRKTKARARRNSKKKMMKGKEGGLDEDMIQGGVMEDLIADSPEGSTFTFKAVRGKRNADMAMGSGGWPSTATKLP